jgi:PadR family transcriptional regulator PadR
MRKGVLEITILGLLASGERYGSEIVDALSSRRELAITAGTVYPLLSRLKRAGVVESTWCESPIGPPRKYYRLTGTGRRELDAMARVWADMTDEVDQLIAAARR